MVSFRKKRFFPKKNSDLKTIHMFEISRWTKKFKKCSNTLIKETSEYIIVGTSGRNEIRIESWYNIYDMKDGDLIRAFIYRHEDGIFRLHYLGDAVKLDKSLLKFRPKRPVSEEECISYTRNTKEYQDQEIKNVEYAQEGKMLLSALSRAKEASFSTQEDSNPGVKKISFHRYYKQQIEREKQKQARFPIFSSSEEKKRKKRVKLWDNLPAKQLPDLVEEK